MHMPVNRSERYAKPNLSEYNINDLDLHHLIDAGSDQDQEPSPSSHRSTAGTLESTQWKTEVFPSLILDDFGSISLHNISSDNPSVKTALSGTDCNEWMDALNAEIASMVSNEVFEVVEPPPHSNVVGSKWVLKYKRNALGEIERRKARLVAQGFSQKPGVDCNELYSPTPQKATLRLILVFAARHDLHLQQEDIKCACLQGELSETIYMLQPPMFENDTNRV